MPSALGSEQGRRSANLAGLTGFRASTGAAVMRSTRKICAFVHRIRVSSGWRNQAAALLLASACSTTPVATQDVGTDGVIPCPGLQCPCPCEAPLRCGPHNACTRPCTSPADCGGAQGETCIAGLCGISCSPGGPNDCAAVGMIGGVCREIQGVAVCSYPRPDVAAPGADSTGSP